MRHKGEPLRKAFVDAGPDVGVRDILRLIQLVGQVGGLMFGAQVGQGPVTLHSEEHFGQSDRGILMIRRTLSEQLEAMDDPFAWSTAPAGR